jgi:hypothetical protein
MHLPPPRSKSKTAMLMNQRGEDALIAVLKAKTAHPKAAITYAPNETPVAMEAIRIPARSSASSGSS